MAEHIRYDEMWFEPIWYAEAKAKGLLGDEKLYEIDKKSDVFIETCDALWLDKSKTKLEFVGGNEAEPKEEKQEVEWISFETCVMECIKNKEFMEQYRRLTWSRIWLNTSPINTMIDEATGYDKKQYKELFDFVMEFIFIPLLSK